MLDKIIDSQSPNKDGFGFTKHPPCVRRDWIKGRKWNLEGSKNETDNERIGKTSNKPLKKGYLGYIWRFMEWFMSM